ncbi:MAG: hypothetical protein JWR67_985, partial [Mucilaginibacter sp.]|nr:hypothetical protein [Mucilaginibacter sp.]
LKSLNINGENMDISPQENESYYCLFEMQTEPINITY